ncbi:MAG: hypothetical protein KJ676_12520 [Alphaproteobacteria bacterium]|nr:hypothetical protein [Alphaproteobacteria bacterium]MBU1525121.1 hypothetical protein [Alphaproteobacteria bacterium]MBU2116138.1 hypothetical protein [Alphaproteobacteria bacterium]MBU2351293.1 hypothetical protein [Alphaproteobacteria bacterium]MBU2382379.1 hypothetical protein [Alphaproteobacteria bacterium]
MSRPDQTAGRKANGAIPPGKPDASTPDRDVSRTGERARRSAGPDGPDATEVGDTFKRTPG